MHPPLVNVTPRIMLDQWASNTFMPAQIDDNSCTLLFKAVIKNLHNQEFAPEVYQKIKTKCLSYLTLNSKDYPETTSDDDLLEDENSPFSLYNCIYSLVEQIVAHKDLLFHLQDTHQKWESEWKNSKKAIVFSINNIICTLQKNKANNTIVYTEITPMQNKMRHIKTLTLTQDELERIKADDKGECFSVRKRLGKLGINFDYSVE